MVTSGLPTLILPQCRQLPRLRHGRKVSHASRASCYFGLGSRRYSFRHRQG
jgi:hypothetical protein